MVYVGKIVSFHGVKGEIKIISKLEYKDLIFKKDNILNIDNKEYKILSYRHHKIYDMVTLFGYNNLDDVLFLKNKDVYIDRCYLKDILLDEDLLEYYIIYNNKKGKIIEIFDAGNNNKIIRGLFDKEVLIPLNNVKIDNKNKQIIYEIGE